MKDEKFKKLDEMYKKLGNKIGKDKIKNKDGMEYLPRFCLSSPSLNYIMGGGLPKGRIIELYGSPSGGKSSLAIIMTGDIQKLEGHVVYLDVEYSFDFEYSEKLGLNTDEKYFKLIRPDSGEETLDIVQALVESQNVDLVIIDSVASLVPMAEVEGSMGDQQMGLQARLMSKALRKLTSIASNSETTILFINQIRKKIGQMWGSPNTTSGGEALKFYSSIRLDTRRIEFIKKGNDVTGIKTKVKCEKNKTAPPKKEVEIDLYFDRGLDFYKEYLDFAISFNFVEKSGSWYSYNNEQIGQGKDNVVKYLKENDSVFKELKTKVDNVLFPKKEN